MKITEYMQNHLLFLDGGMGTLLQEKGLAPGQLPERWNLAHPEIVTAIHREYFDAGSNVVSTNTFGANALKLERAELESVIGAAVENARRAAAESQSPQPKWVALDIGPTGRMLAPYGDLDFEDAVEIFAETVRLGVRCGVDLIFIETMNDSYETKAALLAAKENSGLPVFVSNAYGEDGKGCGWPAAAAAPPRRISPVWCRPPQGRRPGKLPPKSAPGSPPTPTRWPSAKSPCSSASGSTPRERSAFRRPCGPEIWTTSCGRAWPSRNGAPICWT